MTYGRKLIAYAQDSLFLTDSYLHEQDHLYRRILPAGKPASLYADEADTGYTGGHPYHQGKMGEDAGPAFL